MITSVLSGKGGTGKTFVSVNLACTAENAEYIDCDVEEPNGHIFLKPQINSKKDVTVAIPVIDHNKCTGCRVCINNCKFNALAYIKEHVEVFEEICHSCRACSILCPENAISEEQKPIGSINSGISGKLKVVSGILNTGEESGVPIIKELLNEIDSNKDVFIDSPPGSSCTVMESIKDADYCILVTEPTIFGMHNLKMVVKLVRIFNKPHGVVINKSDGLFPALDDYLEKNKIKVLLKIPYDSKIGETNSNGLIAVEEDEKYKKIFENLYKKLIKEAGNV